MSALERKLEALTSVRRLIRTGNNKSYWRAREQQLEDDIEAILAKQDTSHDR